jgi:uncharacterized membrane protein
MSRRSRKKKADRRPKRPTVVSPSPKMAKIPTLSAEVTKFQPDGTVLTSKEILVAAPVELCFNILANKLERLPEWDPTVIYVKPVSEVRRQIGARSEVILSLGGRRLQALAVISRYQPNRAIVWVLTGKPKIKEDWQLEPRLQGTLVSVTITREVGGRVIGRLLDKIMYRKKVEDDLTKMLTRFKLTAESSSGDQRIAGYDKPKG